ncbi:MAG: polyphosphate kinase 1, partial [Ignavibacteria bacterium]
MKFYNFYNFYNRDLSWLSFNERVLQEAQDQSVPLLERVRFMAIFSSNLEEFFRVRVSALRAIMDLKKKSQKELDFKADELLKEIHKKVNELQKQFGKLFKEEIIPGLKTNNISILNEAELNEDEGKFVNEFFFEKVYPNLNPMMLVKKKITPFLKTGILYLALRLSSENKNKEENKKKNLYAIVEIPTDKLQRFIILPSAVNETKLIFLDDVIRFSLLKIFKGYEIEETCSVKLTRDAELYIEDEFSGSLLEKIKKNLSKRTTGEASRFLFDEKISKNFLKFLKESLNITNEDLIAGARYHNFSDMFNLPHHQTNELEYENLKPIINKDLADNAD